MEPLTKVRAKYLNETAYMYNSVKRPGFVYVFVKKTGDVYRCRRCWELGKSRVVTIVDDVPTGKKSLEDDHHTNCEPLPEAVVQAEQLDRYMRHEVRSSGKRPREAYKDIMTVC